MIREWQLQEAKNRMSELINRALSDGPQTITRHGKPAVVVISAATYQKMSQPRKPLSQALRESPLRGVGLDIERDKSRGRDVQLGE
jgi:antitoxin Phd